MDKTVNQRSRETAWKRWNSLGQLPFWTVKQLEDMKIKRKVGRPRTLQHPCPDCGIMHKTQTFTRQTFSRRPKEK